MLDNFLPVLMQGTLETLYMVFAASAISTLFGIPLGILLFITQKGGISENTWYNHSLSAVVNVIRSIPFIILLIALIPFTRLLIGSAIGTTAAIVPLSIAAIPFLARIVDSSLMKVGNDLCEAGASMGATPFQIIYKIMLPEALPQIVHGITLTLIGLIGYSAMAGAVGGGGLGSVAINYGYQRFDVKIMIATIVILVLLVYLAQYFGDKLAKQLSH